MKIEDLTDPTPNVNIDLKIIWDQSEPEEKWGRKIKTVIAVDIDNETSNPSVMLDLYDEDIDKFKFQDKIRIVNGFAKKSQNKREQYRIGYGINGGKLIGHYEKL